MSLSLVNIVRGVLRSGNHELRTKAEISEMLYEFQYCTFCHEKMDCCTDTVIVSTHGVYCPKCWSKCVEEWIINHGGNRVVVP